jgi:hypothetical protein
MDTVLIIADDHATWEFLLSYNPGGDYVDCVQIGDIMNYAGDRGEAHIKGNKVTYKTTWSEGEDSGESLFVYEITPDLHFYKQTQKQTDKKNNSMGPIIAIAILALLIGHMVYVVFFSKKFLNRTFTPEYFQQLRRNNGQSEFASEEEDELANNSLDEAFLSFPYLKGENQLRQPRSKKQLKEAVTWVNQVILNVKPTNPDTIEYLNTLIKIINTNSYRIYTSSLLVVIFGILIGIIAGTHTVLGGVIWGMLTIAYFLSGYCPVFLATKRSKQFFGGVDGEDIEKLEIKCMISDSKTIHPYKDVLINEYSTKGSSNAMAGFLWKLFFSFLKTTLMVFIVIFNYLRNYILFI